MQLLFIIGTIIYTHYNIIMFHWFHYWDRFIYSIEYCDISLVSLLGQIYIYYGIL